MNTIKKLSAIAAMGLLSVSAFAASPVALGADEASGDLTFENKTGSQIDVSVNGAPGAPISVDGRTFKYWFVRILCVVNKDNCNTDYLVGGKKIANSVFNSNTGKVVSYEVFDSAYDVKLTEEGGVLRKVTVSK